MIESSYKMGSPNLNKNTNKGMERRHICSVCGKKYAMEWAKQNHEKHHNETKQRRLRELQGTAGSPTEDY